MRKKVFYYFYRRLHKKLLRLPAEKQKNETIDMVLKLFKNEVENQLSTKIKLRQL